MSDDTRDDYWRVVDTHPNYRISNDGEYIQNITTGRILKQCDNNKGYRTVNLYNNGEKTTYGVHRLIAEQYVPGGSPELTVNHKDGNKHNNHPDNLEWVTYSENELHAHRTGLKHGPKRRPVKVIESGETFPSVKACARAINGNEHCITECLRGNYATHMGLSFEYANIDPDKVDPSDGRLTRECAVRKPYKKSVRIVETGEIFSSIRECARAIDGNQATISECLNGRHKSHCGYHYEWVE